MIISRVENNGIVNGLYNSSNILASEYNKTSKDLIITFGYGGKYKYLEVSLTDFTRFESAESQGKVLNSHIKTNYGFEKLENGDVKLIKESITDAYNDEVESFKESIILQMKENLDYQEKNDNFHMVQLDGLFKTYKIYKEKKEKLNNKK